LKRRRKPALFPPPPQKKKKKKKNSPARQSDSDNRGKRGEGHNLVYSGINKANLDRLVILCFYGMLVKSV
jgi:hypothetical protein